MLMEYIKDNYKEGEPIFTSDLLTIKNNKYALSKELSLLVSENKLRKYEDGIYYIPKETILGNVPLSYEEVAKYKYISKNGDFYGYYGGLYLANKIGITTQVPQVIDIITNKTNSSARMITINNHKFYIKPTKTKINAQNVYVLQLLDLLKDIDKYKEYSNDYLSDRIKHYISLYKIKKEDIDCYIGLFPIVVYKSIYELSLYDVFV